MKIDLELNAGETLHVFQKPAGDATASSVTLTTADGAEQRLAGPASDDFTRSIATRLAGGPASLAFDEGNTAVSLVYAFDPTKVAEEGIRTLYTPECNRPNAARYRLHLAPPFGWMNDPNGLSQAGGLAQLFYQHYPHSLRWNTMHWGHAVTANGIDWIHQPVFLLRGRNCWPTTPRPRPASASTRPSTPSPTPAWPRSSPPSWTRTSAAAPTGRPPRRSTTGRR